ncbi:MAG: M23/M56 family metallopeptidase, partial [Robiginitomaculum sp.]|nr:M23/M56 family metallopeptidase [Robiginitomaculum sp.]
MWLIGSCVALSRLGFAVWQGQMLSRRFMPVIFNGATLSRSVTIVRSKGVSAPFVFGFLKPVIVVPGDFSLDLANLETRVILEHEIAHIVRGDLWVNLAQRLILALLWWCIPLYWINRQIGAERENLCDARATAQTKQNLPNADNTARMLAGALLRFAEQKSHVDTPALAIGIHANLRPEAKLLARRIQLLCDNNPVPQLPKKLFLSTTLAVPMTLLMLSIVTPRASAENPQALQTEGIVSLQKTTGHREEARIKKTTKPAPHANIVTGRMTSKYGVLRKHLNNKFHNGIDIANKTGTPIYAPADALVIEATDTYKNTTKWGKVVVIETRRTNGINGNVQTVFAHLDGYSVDPGQTIKAGDIIGQVGNTGKSTGSHVHIAT